MLLFLANRIHISLFCKQALDEYYPDTFQFELRGDCNVKGKGKMETYWLIGKQGFPFEVDMEAAKQLEENTSYWRI